MTGDTVRLDDDGSPEAEGTRDEPNKRIVRSNRTGSTVGIALAQRACHLGERRPRHHSGRRACAA